MWKLFKQELLKHAVNNGVVFLKDNMKTVEDQVNWQFDGKPSLAATVISRASLPNSLERTLSWRPLRCMMFLNWE